MGHSDIRQNGGVGLVQIVELCDKFELREEFVVEAKKLDEDDEKKKDKKNES